MVIVTDSPIKVHCTSMLRQNHGIFLAAVVLFWACGELNRIQLPQGVNTHFRTDEIHRDKYRPAKVTVFNFGVLSDSVYGARRVDTIVSYGLILPYSTMATSTVKRKMVFGNDSRRCSILYDALNIFMESGSHSMAGDLLFPPDVNRSLYEEESRSTVPYYKLLTGSLYHEGTIDSVPLYFEHIKPGKSLDTATIKGYLVYKGDTIHLQPSYKAIPRYTGDTHPMFILQGFSLAKGDHLYAFLQHAPIIKPGDILYLDFNSSQPEQLASTAFLTLVSTLLYSETPNMYNY
jgi:hypothetical protein